VLASVVSPLEGMSTRPRSPRLLPQLLAVPAIACLMGSCGGEETPRTPLPAVDITAERGRPIADDVLVPWMQYHGIPGASIAVASGGAIDWAKGYGVADQTTHAPVTVDTVFQAASISKPVAAVTALGFLDARGLGLDTDVREVLTSWRFPENALTQKAPVTMRLLLSHSAGFNVHGFAGYDSGRRNRLPSLLQILDGTPPANSEPIRVVSEPGAGYLYSGGGYQVVQQVLGDLSGAAYADLVQARVFAPATMSRSSLMDPVGDAASAHDEEGRVVTGRWHLYPELAAAAVWTTPSDLVRFATLLQLSYHGESEALLPADVTRAMLTAQRPTDTSGQSIGLGASFSKEPAPTPTSSTAGRTSGIAVTCSATSTGHSRSRS
jgi:CubicO group peptidase (beta-lactamase class C family)